jgi:predicted metalloendopeptidase
VGLWPVGLPPTAHSITIAGEDYSSQALKVLAWRQRLSLKWLPYPVPVLYRPAIGTDAWYSTIQNSVSIFAGILQAVVYNSSLPLPLLYGSLGTIVAHEIIHGFDSNGRLYDADGNARLVDMWSREATEGFTRRTRCLVEQYGGVEVKINATYSVKVDGEMTLAENTADNGGMRIAYHTLKQLLGSGAVGAQTRIRGLERFSAEQLFFIAYARVRLWGYR